MTTLFATESTRLSSTPSGAAVILYALAGLICLGLAIAGFRHGQHSDRAWIHAITAGLFLFSAALNLSSWRKERRAS